MEPDPNKRFDEDFEAAADATTKMLERLSKQGHDLFPAILAGALHPLLYVANRNAPRPEAVSELLSLCQVSVLDDIKRMTND